MKMPLLHIDDLHSIADLIHGATQITQEKRERFVTTKEKQIAFMWQLYGMGFTEKEIAKIYGVRESRIRKTLERCYDLKGKK